LRFTNFWNNDNGDKATPIVRVAEHLLFGVRRVTLQVISSVLPAAPAIYKKKITATPRRLLLFHKKQSRMQHHHNPQHVVFLFHQNGLIHLPYQN